MSEQRRRALADLVGGACMLWAALATLTAAIVATVEGGLSDHAGTVFVAVGLGPGTVAVVVSVLGWLVTGILDAVRRLRDGA